MVLLKNFATKNKRETRSRAPALVVAVVASMICVCLARCYDARADRRLFALNAARVLKCLYSYYCIAGMLLGIRTFCFSHAEYPAFHLVAFVCLLSHIQRYAVLRFKCVARRFLRCNIIISVVVVIS